MDSPVGLAQFKRLTWLRGILYVTYIISISAEHSMSPVTLLLYHIASFVSLSATVMKAGNSIQRIKKDSSLNELQPPPYPDEGSVACRSSRSRSGRGVRRGSSPQGCDSPRCSSETSEDQDTESYLNKGCEEDIPSDSTAVLGPEVRLKSFVFRHHISESVHSCKGLSDF